MTIQEMLDEAIAYGTGTKSWTNSIRDIADCAMADAATAFGFLVAAIAQDMKETR